MNHLKRPHSPESDSCDEFGDEMCAVTGSTMTEGGTTRKRRRGIIEKRRRDRINLSLNELKKLVPTALEKSGSAKLEKAEILQMTVDHLKILQTTGGKSGGGDLGGYDPQRFAMDYHNFGFRECAAEVARYLSSVEGLDAQDPLKLRLMSHLQIFAAQRGVAAGSAAAAAAHNPQSTSPTSAAPYGGTGHHGHQGAGATQQHQVDMGSAAAVWQASAYCQPASGYETKIPSGLSQGYEHITPKTNELSAGFTPSAGGFFDYFNPPAASSPPSSQPSPAPPSSRPPAPQTSAHYSSPTTAFSPLSTSSSSSSPSPFSSPSNGYGISSTTSGSPSAPSSKPYRPWGAEMAC